MAKTTEDHLKLITGDLVVTVARLSAENDTLREQLAAVHHALEAAQQTIQALSERDGEARP